MRLVVCPSAAGIRDALDARPAGGFIDLCAPWDMVERLDDERRTRLVFDIAESLAAKCDEAGAAPALVTIPPALSARAGEVAFWARRRWRDTAVLAGADGTESAMEFWRPEPFSRRTRRFLLTLAAPENLRAFSRAVADDRVWDSILSEPPADDDAFADRRLEAWRNWARGPAHNLWVGIHDPGSGEMLGECGARPIPRDPRGWMIGYIVAPAHWGKGIATEGVGALVDELFENRDAAYVEATVYTTNPASRRVLERLGFVCEGLCEDGVEKRNARRSQHRFAINRPRWAARSRVT